MDRFQAIAAFVKVVEAGSFVRAAERLGVSVSSVSRHVADLEAHLDARLLQRTTRRLSLTEVGRAFHERCVPLLADLDEAEASAGAGTIVPRGTLRISCGVSFGTRYVASAVAAFMARYPDMRFDLELSDRIVDLVEEGFDAAIRVGAIGGQNLVGRPVGATKLVCCASPAYLSQHGEPRTPADLVRHPCLLYQYAAQRDTWTFTDRAGAARKVRVAGPVYANNGTFLAALAEEGVGIVYEPDFILGPGIRAGRLVPILRTFPPPTTGINVVYASRRHLSAKVRAFAEFLAERFAKPEWALESAVNAPRAARKR